MPRAQWRPPVHMTQPLPEWHPAHLLCGQFLEWLRCPILHPLQPPPQRPPPPPAHLHPILPESTPHMNQPLSVALFMRPCSFTLLLLDLGVRSNLKRSVLMLPRWASPHYHLQNTLTARCHLCDTYATPVFAHTHRRLYPTCPLSAFVIGITPIHDERMLCLLHVSLSSCALVPCLKVLPLLALPSPNSAVLVQIPPSTPGTKSTPADREEEEEPEEPVIKPAPRFAKFERNNFKCTRCLKVCHAVPCCGTMVYTMLCNSSPAAGSGVHKCMNVSSCLRCAVLRQQC